MTALIKGDCFVGSSKYSPPSHVSSKGVRSASAFPAITEAKDSRVGFVTRGSR